MSERSATRYLLDTCVLVALIRQNDLGQWVEQTFQLSRMSVTPIISIVTEGELQSLARQFRWGERPQRRMDRLVQSLVSIPLGLPRIIETYGDIDHFSRQQGRRMGKNDAWIAATTHVTGTHLLTTDADFDHLAPEWITLTRIDPSNYR